MPDQKRKNLNFNSQPHKEADEYPNIKKYPTLNISTHSLTRRLTRLWHMRKVQYLFQLTASQGG